MRLYNLRQKNKQILIRAILLGCMKKLSEKKKYLGTILSSYAFLEDGQYYPQRLSKEANNNISTSELCSIHSKANSQALYKAKIKMFSKKRYKRAK